MFGEGPTEIVSGGFNDTKRQAFTAKDIRFTVKGDALYAVVLGLPERGEVIVQSLSANLRLYNQEIGKVELLGVREPLQWSRGAAGLCVKLPGEGPCGHALVLKVTPKK